MMIDSRKILRLAALFLLLLAAAGALNACRRPVSSCLDGKEHVFSAWEDSVPAGCETGGVQTRVCSVCGATEEKKTEPLGHDYQPDRFVWDKTLRADVWMVCSHNASHTSTQKAEVREEILTEATSEKAGIKRCTAVFGALSETVEGSYMADEVKLKVYAVNDFHGAVKASPDSAGLLLFASYFKEKGEDPNTLLLDQGDTFQGSIYSNYNYGRMITDVYNYVRFDARTLGNHEFDWGLNPIRENTAHSSYGYKTPVLAANVYDYDFNTKRAGSVQQEDLGVKSVVYTLQSGVTVGIVGVIGKDQITSINSLYSRDICFLDHIQVIKEESAALRAAGCDLVICSIHADEDDVRGHGLESYVDLVLCAHSHTLESSKEGDLLYAQFKSNGQYFGEITLSYSPESGKVSSKMRALSAATLREETTRTDETIESILRTYSAQCDSEADVIVASNVSGLFTADETLPNLMCRAIYDECVKEGFPVCLVYINKARATLSGGNWTYADLYDAFPFDDVVYIADVTGKELLSQARYNYMYRSPAMTADGIDPNAVYRIACIDYVFFHTNTQRSYDRFPTTAGNYVGVLSDHYRLILRGWLEENGYAEGKTLSANFYMSSLRAHDPSRFYSDKNAKPPVLAAEAAIVDDRKERIYAA